MSGLNFSHSEELLARALKCIPNGTQTFSKSRTQYPLGASPFYITRGKGSHVWDVDGNKYIDFVSGLTPIILGYCDPDVDDAVREQMKYGVIFSLPHPLEIEVSEMICEMVPCAEMVRFGKNGSDCTAGAVRLARAHTGRDIIARCGYHGWQDWCIGTTGRNAGVPQAVRALTKEFVYNDIKSLDHIFRDNPSQVACVIMEPMNREWPIREFLKEVKELTHKNGAILIFDEVITGFRFALGGAQECFGVIPDLACFGKAIANGYPLSAIAGKADIMQTMNAIHFSFTNAGECMSLAAAKATLNKIKRDNVPELLFNRGRIVKEGLATSGTVETGCGLLISEKSNPLTGHPSWSHWDFPDNLTKTKIIQELIQRGILMIGTHNMNASHSIEDIGKLLQAYSEILPNLDKIELKCQPLNPLFKVR